MTIKSVKAEYRLKAAENLEIILSVDYDAERDQYEIYEPDPDVGIYGLKGRLKVCDKTGEVLQMWDRKIDLSAALHYGILDELMENTIHEWAKGMLHGDAPDQIVPYDADDPAVIWLCYRLPFVRVVTGENADFKGLVTFSAEIEGTAGDGTAIKATFAKAKLPAVWVYRNGIGPEDHRLDRSRLESFSNVMNIIERDRFED
ncbi:MAG: hypothetical protein IK078_00830 [Lachnospiraceae bacterium]|nr:hypothetical protein [Lachnospiraceae bacterium]